MYSLKGKVAVVTGAARGIGRSICVALAKAGADIFAIDIMGLVSTKTSYPPSTEEDMLQTKTAVQALNVRFEYAQADIRSFEGMQAVAAQAVQTMGKVDILAANAGIQTFEEFPNTDETYWTDTIGVNLLGTAYTIRAFAPYMIKQNYGRIIATSSTQGKRGLKHGAAYSASKWGIIGLVKSAAFDLGQHQITVNAIVPGLIDTTMTRNPKRWQEAMGEVMKNPPENPSEEEVVKAISVLSPLSKPWISPDDVAPTVAYLASDEAAMVSGAVYDITEGRSAQLTA